MKEQKISQILRRKCFPALKTDYHWSIISRNIPSHQINKESDDDAVNKIGEHTAHDRNQDKGLN